MQESQDYVCMCGKLTDKFADNGLVTVVAGKKNGEELEIILWLMSCRVLKRDMENVMMNVWVEEVKKRQIKKSVGVYIPTAKNSMLKDFYGSMGIRKNMKKKMVFRSGN